MAKSKTDEVKKAILERPNKDQRGAYWVSSGSDLMDLVVGGGRGMGYETGMSIIFEANSSAGKSFLAHEVIAAAYHKYGPKFKWEYLDCESGCTFDSRVMWGVEVMPPAVEDRKRPETIEECFSTIMAFLNKLEGDEFGVLIVDSIDGLLSEAGDDRANKRVEAFEKGKEFDEKSYGMEKAKYLSQEFWPKINSEIEKKNCILIGVSQYREAQGQYGSVKKISNGQAITYYPHARVKFTKKNDIVVKGRAIGAVIEVETIKMKGPWPYRSCFVTLYFTKGIDNTATNIDYLFDFRTKERGELSKTSQTGLSWKEGMDKMDRETMIRYVEENNLEGELRDRVIVRWYEEEKEAAKQLEGRKSRYGV